MVILLDTSILGRLANRADVSHAVAKAAIAELHRRGEMLHMTSQNLIEFRNFAPNRPTTIPAGEDLSSKGWNWERTYLIGSTANCIPSPPNDRRRGSDWLRAAKE